MTDVLSIVLATFAVAAIAATALITVAPEFSVEAFRELGLDEHLLELAPRKEAKHP